MEGRGSAAVSHLAVVAIMALVLAMAPGALAVNHVVGGATGWTIPSSNSYYDGTWAAGTVFTVGDTLQFEYAASAHDVVQYNTKAEYDACAGTAVKTYNSGNDTVSLPTAGVWYFICSIPGHCTQGMKVSVTVGAATATPPTTTPSPPTTTPSPPATNTPPAVASPPPPAGTGSSAASLGPILSMAGLFVAALVATLAFLV